MNIEVAPGEGVVGGIGRCLGQPAISHCQVADSARQLRIEQNFIDNDINRYVFLIETSPSFDSLVDGKIYEHYLII